MRLTPIEWAALTVIVAVIAFLAAFITGVIVGNQINQRFHEDDPIAGPAMKDRQAMKGGSK